MTEPVHPESVVNVDDGDREVVPENGDLRGRPLHIVVWIVVLVIVGLLSANAVWTALQNLITVPPLITKNYAFYRANHLDGLIKPVPWVPLVIALVVPVVAFVGAVVVGRHRSLVRRVTVLILAVCASSAVAASISAYISTKYGL